jgi:hypothetical protein
MHAFIVIFVVLVVLLAQLQSTSSADEVKQAMNGARTTLSPGNAFQTNPHSGVSIACSV